MSLSSTLSTFYGLSSLPINPRFDVTTSDQIVERTLQTPHVSGLSSHAASPPFHYGG